MPTPRIIAVGWVGWPAAEPGFPGLHQTPDRDPAEPPHPAPETVSPFARTARGWAERPVLVAPRWRDDGSSRLARRPNGCALRGVAHGLGHPRLCRPGRRYVPDFQPRFGNPANDTLPPVSEQRHWRLLLDTSQEAMAARSRHHAHRRCLRCPKPPSWRWFWKARPR